MRLSICAWATLFLLHHRVDEPLTVFAEGVEQLLAYPGRKGRRLCGPNNWNGGPTMSNVEPWMLKRLESHLHAAGEELASWLPASSENGLTVKPDHRWHGGARVTRRWPRKHHDRRSFRRQDERPSHNRPRRGTFHNASAVAKADYLIHLSSRASVWIAWRFTEPLVGGPLRLAEIDLAEEALAGIRMDGQRRCCWRRCSRWCNPCRLICNGVSSRPRRWRRRPDEDEDGDEQFVPASGSELANSTQAVAAIEFQALQATGGGPQSTRPLDLLMTSSYKSPPSSDAHA